ncbi:lipocalin family protein [Verrucomicrobium spinosum]|uniref:lipocalin family protein n=1 Tax=Verrucomicrobium spinosum TaxID=2736 RepID=UPI0001746401|nr:lipocalin family protein [Verrucomicrobium spinosum]
MKTSTLIFGGIGLLALAACATGSKSNVGPPPTVASVDLKRYTGTWYEIARFPHSFEKGASHVTANYLSMPDGTVKVVNRAMKNGKPDSIEGVATPVSGSNGAKLKVKFFTFLPSGNYWVLALDDKNYQWAMVGEGSRKYLWILSRTPQMDKEVYETLVNRAREIGYDVGLLEKVEQG